MAFDVPPAFRFGPGIDWSPINNALEGYGQGIERAYKGETNRLIGDALSRKDFTGAQAIAAQRGDLDTNLNLGKYKMAEASHGLQQTRTQQEIDREKKTLPLDLQAKQQGLASTGLDIQSKRDAAEKELYGRASAIAQMIEAEPDLVRQRDMLNKFYGADPRIKSAIGEKLPKELLDDPIAVARYMRAVHAGYQAPQTTKVGKDEALVTTSRDPNNPAAPPKVGQVYKNDGNDKFKDEHQLRGELSQQPTVKNFSEVKSGYQRMTEGREINDSKGSGAGDLAIVYGYMKMLDPTSVVREGEFATAEKTAGIPQQVVGLYNKVISGERLPPAVREEFMKMAGGLYQRNLADVTKIQDQYRQLAIRNRLDPSNVILDLGMAPKPQQGGNLPRFNPAPQPQAPAPGLRTGIGAPPLAPGQPPPPAQPPAMQSRQPGQQIPPGAIQALQSDPGRAAEFDAKYGPGASRQFLMQR